jgi:RNA polymerase sigma-70 factor (ECF subfamily)
LTQDVFVRVAARCARAAAFSTYSRTALRSTSSSSASGRKATERARHPTPTREFELIAMAVPVAHATARARGRRRNCPTARGGSSCHDVEGYKHEEIAGMLGIATSTSKAQLHRARTLLRRHLGSRHD